MARNIEAAKNQVGDEALRRAVIAGISTHTGAAIRAIKARTILIVAGAMLGTTWPGQGRDTGLVINSASPLIAALGIKANATLATMPLAEGAVWARLIADKPRNIIVSMQQ